MNKFTIELTQIGFSYDRTEVLSLDHLSIKKGLTTVFLGPNGSGKTTLLKILSGLSTPCRGKINFSTEKLRENAIIVHQVPYLFSGTVRYNIDFVLRLKKTAAADRSTIINKVLKQADLMHLVHRNTSQLSGGERHRLAIARALSVDPDILILDEPFAHIDRTSRILIENIISLRSLSGKTTLLSTHELTSAYRLADRIVSLENGRITEPKYNFLKGTVFGKDDQFCHFLVHQQNKKLIILAPASNGEFKAGVIPYSDIFLSRTKIETSAQNQLPGKIIFLKKINSQFIVTIDCGIELKAIITSQSVKEFQLEEKKKIFVNFKASAVKLY